MKTTKEQLQNLRLRLFELPSAAAITLPVELVTKMVDDALDFHKCEETLDRGFAALMALHDDDEKTTKMPAAPKPRRHLQVVREGAARLVIDGDKLPPGGDAA